jgi:hypothetical protein
MGSSGGGTAEKLARNTLYGQVIRLTWAQIFVFVIYKLSRFFLATSMFSLCRNNMFGSSCSQRRSR